MGLQADAVTTILAVLHYRFGCGCGFTWHQGAVALMHACQLVVVVLAIITTMPAAACWRLSPPQHPAVWMRWFNEGRLRRCWSPPSSQVVVIKRKAARSGSARTT
jgi:hypothetical protein